MKKVFCLILVCMFSFSAMAQQVITITVPNDKVSIAVEGYLSIYPNTETIDDPEWVDPEDGSEAPQIAKYSTAQWIREKGRRNFVRDVRRGLQMKTNIANRIILDEGVAD